MQVWAVPGEETMGQAGNLPVGGSSGGLTFTLSACRLLSG